MDILKDRQKIFGEVGYLPSEAIFYAGMKVKDILKLIALLLQIVILNLVVFLMSVASVAVIGEDILWKEICLLHLAYFLIQVELAGICFGISAFLRSSGLGIGLGIAIVMYFLNIVANISESAEVLKIFTPFGYAEEADIIANGSLDTGMVLLGMGFAVIGVVAAYWKYLKKDIR